MKLLLLPLVLLASSQPASADFSIRETRIVMHDYARCVVKAHPMKAAQAVASDWDNQTVRRKYPMLFSPECLAESAYPGVSMGFGSDLYRYALADALVSIELAGWTPPDLAAVPPLAHRDPGARPSQVSGSGERLSNKQYQAALGQYVLEEGYAYLSRHGECTVRLDPPASKALLMTRPASSNETAAFAKLRTAFERCREPGQTSKFGKIPLRGAVALNFYRLAHASRSAATGMGR